MYYLVKHFTKDYKLKSENIVFAKEFLTVEDWDYPTLKSYDAFYENMLKRYYLRCIKDEYNNYNVGEAHYDWWNRRLIFAEDESFIKISGGAKYSGLHKHTMDKKK